MNGLLATFERELRAYFFSSLAYVVLTFFLLANGIGFLIVVTYLSNPQGGAGFTPFEFFFSGFFFWILVLISPPILTMRLISEERKSGTIETLMTSPVSEVQVVLGKYFAALALYVFLWLPTVLYAVILEQHSDVDWGPILSGYLGTLGIGAMFLAIGVFGSSFTKNQIVAAIATFAILMFLFTFAFFEGLVTSETTKDVIGYVNLLQHMEDFGKGVVDTRRLVYYATTAALFLFLSCRALEAKKWR